jgi:hypothetical protein
VAGGISQSSPQTGKMGGSVEATGKGRTVIGGIEIMAVRIGRIMARLPR